MTHGPNLQTQRGCVLCCAAVAGLGRDQGLTQLMVVGALRLLFSKLPFPHRHWGPQKASPSALGARLSAQPQQWEMTVAILLLVLGLKL
jgi:hypothetical protein